MLPSLRFVSLKAILSSMTTISLKESFTTRIRFTIPFKVPGLRNGNVSIMIYLLSAIGLVSQLNSCKEKIQMGFHYYYLDITNFGLKY